MVQTLRKQYFYQTIHPRTIGQESASFKTAIKALMWLAESFAEEVKKREREQQMTPLVAGLKQKQHGEGNEQAKLSEFLTEKQISRLQLVGYTLQQGKRLVEEKQEVLDSRPLVEAEIQSLKGRIEELREDMRVQFTKRSKLQQKVKSWKRSSRNGKSSMSALRARSGKLSSGSNRSWDNGWIVR